MGKSVRTVKGNTNILGRSVRTVKGNTNILGRSVRTVKGNTDALLFASKETGLEVNADKTKYMVRSQDQNAG